MNRSRYLVGFGGGQDEFDVLGRFFQGFQQCVEGARRKHVHFINDINFMAGPGRSINSILTELANVLHTGIGRPIDLQHVNVISFINSQAAFAFATGLAGGLVRIEAVQSLGQNPGHGSLAHSPGPP